MTVASLDFKTVVVRNSFFFFHKQRFGTWAEIFRPVTQL